MDNIHIRAADEGDLGYLRSAYGLLDREMTALLPELLRTEEDGEGHDDTYWMDFIRRKTGFVLIACVGGERAGMALAERQDDRTCHLEDLIVTPEYRGRGIGSALLRKVKRTAKESGCSILSLNVLDSNHRAMSLYERDGFQKVKTLMVEEL